MWHRGLVRASATLSFGVCGTTSQCIETPQQKHDWMRAPTKEELSNLTSISLPSARKDAKAKSVPLPAALNRADRQQRGLPPVAAEDLPTFTAQQVAALADDHFVCVTHGDGVYNVTDFVKVHE